MISLEQIRAAGIVGAGGAGFPTYKKLEAQVETVIANGAECEPLLYKDQVLMETYPGEIIGGLQHAMALTGARQGIVAIKGKNRNAITAISRHLPGNITVFEMTDVYPAGDEYEVVYHSTGRRIPAGGIPLDVGLVVQNVETLYNIFQAMQGRPVTHSMMTVHGHVKSPLTAWFPIGMRYQDVLAVAGGSTINDFVLLAGGPMMGRVVDDLTTPVTKLSSGFIVMPRDSKLAVRKSQSEQAYKRFGKSACDQCSLCTEMCPRYLLGYPIKPHLVMRSLLTTGQLSETLTHWAQACCECNICSLWACPEDLDPRNVCVVTKRDLKKQDKWLSPDQLQKLQQDVHPLKSYRNVPTKRLARKLGLSQFTQAAPFFSQAVSAKSVSVPLQQHIGTPATAVVSKGDSVDIGDVLAEPQNGALGAPVHASIKGQVIEIGPESIVLESP